MSSIRTKLTIACMFALVLIALAGCGNSNSTAFYNPETNVHPADWLPSRHVGAAQQDLNSCGSCHGANLTGGMSGVSCTGCHLGGPTAVHPATWGGQQWFQSGGTTQGHGVFMTEHGTASCKNLWCHGQNLQGVIGSGPSCNTCHTWT